MLSTWLETSKSLYEILDSNYAQDMIKKNIEHLNENEGHLQHLLRNQISVIDSTINIIKQDQAAVNEKFNKIHNQFNEIKQSLHDSQNDEYEC